MDSFAIQQTVKVAFLGRDRMAAINNLACASSAGACADVDTTIATNDSVGIQFIGLLFGKHLLHCWILPSAARYSALRNAYVDMCDTVVWCDNSAPLPELLEKQCILASDYGTIPHQLAQDIVHASYQNGPHTDFDREWDDATCFVDVPLCNSSDDGASRKKPKDMRCSGNERRHPFSQCSLF